MATDKKHAKTFQEPLKVGDTIDKTVGYRHSSPAICAKNSLSDVCAFVRADSVCLATPQSWKKQYLKLKGEN